MSQIPQAKLELLLLMHQDLGNGLILRDGRSTDLEAIKEHVKNVHGKTIVQVVERLFTLHPDFPAEDNFLVIDTATNAVIAYLCLLRSQCVLNGIEIPVGHMEIVGTLPEYRNRGLIRLLNDAFEKRAEKYQLPLLVIAGIPFYYRTFGYEYAIPMGGQLSVPLEEIPVLKKEEKEPVTIEEVTERTFTQFLQIRQKRDSYLDFYRKISPASYSFLTHGKLGDELVYRFYIVKDQEKLVGSFTLSIGWGAFQVTELWLQDVGHIPSILRFVKPLAKRKGLPIRIERPSRPAIMRALEGFTRAKFLRPYAWYVRIPSIKRFIETIKPVLEQRLALSEYDKLSETLRLSWYREGIELVFVDGQLKDIKEIKRADIKDMHAAIPFPVIYQLLLGYRSFDELYQKYPDAFGSSQKTPLVQVLFPKIHAVLSPEF